MLINNIFDVVKFNFILGKYFGFFPFSVNFKSSTEIVYVKSYDYVLYFTSVLLTTVVTYFYQRFSIGEASNSVILEVGVFMLFKICLALTIVIKVTNFIQRKKLICIVTNLHWIDEKVEFEI